MPYTLLYHPQVVEEDLPRLPQNIHSRVTRAIETRLVKAPEQYGAPLKGTLKGYWKLRVGDYRVVYKIVETEVWIFGIIHRKKVYDDVLIRLGWVRFKQRTHVKKEPGTFFGRK